MDYLVESEKRDKWLGWERGILFRLAYYPDEVEQAIEECKAMHCYALWGALKRQQWAALARVEVR